VRAARAPSGGPRATRLTVVVIVVIVVVLLLALAVE